MGLSFVIAFVTSSAFRVQDFFLFVISHCCTHEHDSDKGIFLISIKHRSFIFNSYKTEFACRVFCVFRSQSIKYTKHGFEIPYMGTSFFFFKAQGCCQQD